MTTKRQAEANRRNALASTGPRTPHGKATAAGNAVRHGALSALPVVPGVERAEDWQAHRNDIVHAFAPDGWLERRLAERAALLLWRLDRVARYETAVTAAGLDEAGDEPELSRLAATLEPRSDAVRRKRAPEELADNRRFLADAEAGLRALGRLPGLADEAPLSPAEAFAALEGAANALPEGWACPHVEDEEFLASVGASAGDNFDQVGWTAGLVRRGLALIGRLGGLAPERLAALAARGIEEHRDERRRSVAELAAAVRGLEERHRSRLERRRARLLLPEDNAEAKVLRYEGHLSRQLFQTLHELERMQASREGKPVPPPAVVEVGVSVAGAEGRNLGAGG